MTPGVDTYITPAEADAYVAARYTPAAPQRTRWERLFDDDKAAYLLASCAALEALPWAGFAASEGQPLAFPRVPWGAGRLAALDATVPEAIKNAQAELALWMAGEGGSGASRRAELRAQGVTAFTLGDLSESYAPVSASDAAPLSCPACAALIRRYLGGGHGTC